MFRVYGEYMIWEYMGIYVIPWLFRVVNDDHDPFFSSPGDFVGFSTDAIEKFQLVKNSLNEAILDI